MESKMKRTNATQRRSSVCYWFTRRMALDSCDNGEISCSNSILLCDQHFPSHITCRPGTGMHEIDAEKLKESRTGEMNTDERR